MDWSLLALSGFLVWLIILLQPWCPWLTKESLETDQTLTNEDLSQVTVLIPARNEEAVIEKTLSALATQGHGLQIILIDDQSEDKTAAIARQSTLDNLVIIKGKPLPPGWAGKLWALEQGIKQVRSNLVLLLDADIQLSPGTISSLKIKLEKEKLDMVSLMAQLKMDNVWAKILLPAFIFFFKLLYPFQLANSKSRNIAAAAGGCILLKRTALENTGAFSSLRNSLIDDCTLARKIKNYGGRTWVGLTHSAVCMRSYGNLKIIWDMVARSAFTQLRYSWSILLLCTILMLTGFMLPFIALFLPGPLTHITALATLLMMLACYFPVVNYYALNSLWTLTLPVAGILFLAMTWSSAYRHLFRNGVSWKNRNYAMLG